MESSYKHWARKREQITGPIVARQAHTPPLFAFFEAKREGRPIDYAIVEPSTPRVRRFGWRRKYPGKNGAGSVIAIGIA